MQRKDQNLDRITDGSKNIKKTKHRSRSKSRAKHYIKKTKIKDLNPMITHINENSHFIYDNNFGEDYLNRIINKNLIKLNKEEITILDNEIEKLEFEKSLAKGENIIFIEQSMADDIKNYFHIEKNDNDLKKFLTKEIEYNIE